MKKTYVLDTNVLIHDPEAVLRFQDNDIVLPITVIEELDHLKRVMARSPILLVMRFDSSIPFARPAICLTALFCRAVVRCG